MQISIFSYTMQIDQNDYPRAIQRPLLGDSINFHNFLALLDIRIEALELDFSSFFTIHKNGIWYLELILTRKSSFWIFYQNNPFFRSINRFCTKNVSKTNCLCLGFGFDDKNLHTIWQLFHHFRNCLNFETNFCEKGLFNLVLARFFKKLVTFLLREGGFRHQKIFLFFAKRSGIWNFT